MQGFCPPRPFPPGSVEMTYSLFSLMAPLTPLGCHSGHLIGALDAQSMFRGTRAKCGD